MRSRGPKREPRYGDFDIPHNAESWAADLCEFFGFLPPGKEMANIISNVLYDDRRTPIHAPRFIVSKLHDKQWIDPPQSHGRSDKYWRESVALKAINPAQ